MEETMRTLRPEKQRRRPKIAVSLITLCAAALLSYAAFTGTLAAPKQLAGARTQLPAAAASAPSFFGWAAGAIYRTFCPYVSDCDVEYAALNSQQQPTPTAAKPQPLPAQDSPDGSTRSQASSTPPIVYQTVNQPVIERVIERQRVVTEDGVSETTLADRLNQLENKLRALIFSQSSQQSAQTSAVYNAVALSQRIDNLSGTNISNPTITGGSITGSSIIGTISNAIATALATIDNLTSITITATNATFTNSTTTNATTTKFSRSLERRHRRLAEAFLPPASTRPPPPRSPVSSLNSGGLRLSPLDCTSYANGGTLTTDASGNVVCAADDGGAGSTVAGADTQIQFNNGGSFGAAANFTFSSSTGKLTLPNASTTNLTASYASSTQGFFGSLSIGPLSGILKATAGLVSAASPGFDYESPLTFGYPLTRSLNAISLAFGTTTTNTWTHQIFSSLFATNASTTNATTTNLYITGLSNSGLGVDANGKVYAAATSTLANISGTLALTQLANQNANTVLANATAGSAAPTPISTSSLFAALDGQVLGRVNGTWTGVATTTNSCSSGINCTYSAGTWSFTNTGANFAFPFTTLATYGTTSAATSTSIATQGVFFASSTAAASVFPYASSTALSAGTLCLSTDCRTSWPTGGGIGDPFTHGTNFATTTSATTTSIHTTGVFFASSTVAASQFPFASSTAITVTGTASTSLFFANGLANCASNNVLTWTNGTFGCEPDDTAAGSANPFAWENNYAEINAATTSILWAKNGLNASSTSHFVNASTTAFTNSGSTWLTSLSNSGLGVDANGKVYAAATSTLANISGTLALTQLANQNANTVLANGTAGSAAPTAIATSSLFAALDGQILGRVNGTWTGVATTTFSTGLTYTNGTVTCDTASGSALGCLSSADWTTFNNKQAAGNYITALTGDVTASGPGSASVSFALGNTHWWTAQQNFRNASTSQFTATSSVWFTSLGTPAGTFLAVDPNGLLIATSTPAVGGSGTVTNIATTYPITGGSITTTGTLSLAFGTTTTNTWTHQIFSSLFASGASTTNATTTNLHITSLANSGLGVDANGKVYAAATSTLANIAGVLAVPSGGTGTTTVPSGQVLYGGGAGVYQSVATGTISAGPGISLDSNSRYVLGGPLTITNTGALFAFPFTTSSTYGTTSAATSSSIQTAGVFFASSTAAASQFPFASSTALSAGTLCLSTDCRTSWPTAGGTDDPFTHETWWGQSGVSATTSALHLTGSPFSLFASSTAVFEFASSTAASTTRLTTGTLWFTGLSSSGLGVDANGKVYAAATSTLANISGTLALTQLANQAPNTVLANGTAGSAAPTAIATSSLFAALDGQILGRVNGTWTGVATTTFSTGLTYTNGTVTCDTASGSALGCLSSADWTTFNNKQAAGNYITALTGDVTASGPGSASVSFALGNTHWWTAQQNFGNASTSQFTATSSVWFTSLGTPTGTFLAVDPNGLLIATSTPAVGGSGTVTNIATTYPITGGPITTTGTLSLAFGTSTTNTWAHQIFSSLFALSASTTNATTTNLYITGLASSGLGVDANGKVYAAATSTLSTISGTLALTQLANQNANTVLANATGGSAAPTAIATSSFFGTGTGGTVLAWNSGVPQWVATTTLTNGTGITTTYSAANNQWTITNTGATFAFPFTTRDTYGTTSAATSSSIQTAGVFFASSTAASSVFPFASSTAITLRHALPLFLRQRPHQVADRRRQR